MVSAHVDYLCGLLYALECGFRHVFRCAYESYHSAVCGFSRVNVEEANPLYGTKSVGYSLEFLTVACIS